MLGLGPGGAGVGRSRGSGKSVGGMHVKVDESEIATGQETNQQAELDAEQRRLVRENLGLVAVHLRRNVANLAMPRRDREWDDLFQEGCLGLIKAAVAYRERSGIPFAAFAFPRIHNAVSRALKSKFSTVRIPERRKKPRDPTAAQSDGEDETQPWRNETEPKVHQISEEIGASLTSRPQLGDENDDRETVGDRLRAKYERAVRASGAWLSMKGSIRGDRGELVRVLVEQRFMIPHEESRRALRQIARDTQSSYARVAQCDKQLSEAVRETLLADPEFRELRRRARCHPMGTALPMDPGLEDTLARSGAEEFVSRMRRGGRADRAKLLDALLEVANEGIEEDVRHRVAELPAGRREALLWKTRHAEADTRATRHRPDRGGPADGGRRAGRSRAHPAKKERG